MVWLWLAMSAWAGDVYVNNTLVNPADLSNLTLQDVNVRFDSQGHVFVDAPRYKVEPINSGVPMQAPIPLPVPVVGTPGARTMPQPAVSSAVAAPTGVPKAQYWLVTEDNGSSGHNVEVWVNDALVQRVHSGEVQKIMDMAPYLRPGTNRVVVTSNSQSPLGGAFYVYLGRGSDQSGTVVMDKPDVQYGLGPSRQGPYSREYSLIVGP